MTRVIRLHMPPTPIEMLTETVRLCDKKGKTCVNGSRATDVMMEWRMAKQNDRHKNVPISSYKKGNKKREVLLRFKTTQNRHKLTYETNSNAKMGELFSFVKKGNIARG